MSVFTKSLLFASLVFVANAFGAEIVVPKGVQHADGNSTGLAPTSPTRIQYLYDASFFDAENPIEIRGISWRPDALEGAVEATDTEVVVKLSTVAKTSLVSQFAHNTGDDEREVYRGPTSINATDKMDPRKFSLPIEFQNAFRFDPTEGNLLVDVTFSGFDKTWTVDNQEFSDGKTRLIVGGANASKSFRSWNIVAPMEFNVHSVPEPPKCSLPFLAALTSFGIWRRAGFGVRLAS